MLRPVHVARDRIVVRVAFPVWRGAHRRVVVLVTVMAFAAAVGVLTFGHAARLALNGA